MFFVMMTPPIIGGHSPSKKKKKGKVLFFSSNTFSTIWFAQIPEICELCYFTMPNLFGHKARNIGHSVRISRTNSDPQAELYNDCKTLGT